MPQTKSNLVKIHITVPRKLDKAMTLLIEKGVYASKTDIISEALRQHKGMRKELETFGNLDMSDVNLIMAQKPSLRDNLTTVLKTILALQGTEKYGVVNKEKLFKKLETDGINKKHARTLVGQLLREGTIYSPKSGYLRKT